MKTSNASIHLRNVGVDFPVFNASSMSFKNRVLSAVTGGAIDRKHDGSVIVKGLQNINLKIEAGERVGLIGHNGAGKTTLLRVLSGIYAPTEGEAIINGECVSLINISLGIDPEATGRENIKLRSAMIGFTPKETKERTEEIIEFSGLGSFIEMPFRTYSTGMQLRLAFAVSTIVSPEILILDEWLSTGDRNFRERAENRMREIVDATDILILASHSPALLRANCNRIVWLEHGRIRMDGKPDKVLPEYFGGEPDGAPVTVRAQPEDTPRVLPSFEGLIHESRCEVIFEKDNQPGDSVVKLLACRLKRSTGESLDWTLTSESFLLEIEYEVMLEGFYLRPGCIIKDFFGDVILWSADPWMELAEKPAKLGRHTSVMHIPGRLMAPGLIRFHVAIGDAKTGDRARVAVSDLLRLVVNDDLNDASIRGSYRGAIPGAVRPRLQWDTKHIETTL
jgi:lipopolysaccharide transport system ATP-binding protein